MGIILYELCTLKKPFDAKDHLLNADTKAYQIMESIKKNEPEPIPANYSADLKNLVKLLLIKNAE